MGDARRGVRAAGFMRLTSEITPAQVVFEAEVIEARHLIEREPSTAMKNPLNVKRNTHTAI